MTMFLDGILFLGYLSIALFFLRYWKRSHDRLFLFFAVSFALMSSHRLVMAGLDLRNEVGTWVYWIRLASYLLILYAVIDRNMRQTKP